IQRNQVRQYRLQFANDTRWNSQLTALVRFVKLRSAVEHALKTIGEPEDNAKAAELFGRLTSDWWARAEILRALLLPFLYANKLLQSDSASLHTVNRMYDACKAHL